MRVLTYGYNSRCCVVPAGLRHMLRLSKLLRAKRCAAGALQLASPEVKFKIDTESLDPMDVGMYQVRPRGLDVRLKGT